MNKIKTHSLCGSVHGVLGVDDVFLARGVKIGAPNLHDLVCKGWPFGLLPPSCSAYYQTGSVCNCLRRLNLPSGPILCVCVCECVCVCVIRPCCEQT